MSIQQYQANLFSNGNSNKTVVLKDCGLDAEYYPEFLSPTLAQTWFQQLLEQTSWRQESIVVYGKSHLTPRLSCWLGEPWMTYSYSQHTMQPKPWFDVPWSMKKYVEQAIGVAFNSALINYYRDGKDSNGWHSDDEPELGVEPVIASLSLGAPRDFHLRQKSNHANKHKLSLASGSLLIMRGETQSLWQHQVPKRANADARINVTFRQMVQSSTVL